LLIGMLISGVALFSGCRRHSHGHKAEFMVDYISETLDLNESQQAQLDQIKDELMAKAQGMHADKESLHEELVAQLRSEEIDQVRVKAVIAEHRAKMDEIVSISWWSAWPSFTRP
jgi:Spy/CpxP family protein refolding chaperone